MAVETHKCLDTVTVGDGAASLCERELTDGSIVYDVVCYDKNGNAVFVFAPVGLAEASMLFEAIKNYGA